MVDLPVTLQVSFPLFFYKQNNQDMPQFYVIAVILARVLEMRPVQTEVCYGSKAHTRIQARIHTHKR